jgi:hypothetical protein
MDPTRLCTGGSIKLLEARTADRDDGELGRDEEAVGQDEQGDGNQTETGRKLDGQDRAEHGTRVGIDRAHRPGNVARAVIAPVAARARRLTS